MGEVSHFPSGRASSTYLRNADGKPIGYRIIPASHVVFVPRAPLLTTQVLARRCISKYHSSEVSGLEEPTEVPEVADLEAYYTGVEGEGDWGHSYLTGDPTLEIVPLC